MIFYGFGVREKLLVSAWKDQMTKYHHNFVFPGTIVSMASRIFSERNVRYCTNKNLFVVGIGKLKRNPLGDQMHLTSKGTVE